MPELVGLMIFIFGVCFGTISSLDQRIKSKPWDVSPVVMSGNWDKIQALKFITIHPLAVLVVGVTLSPLWLVLLALTSGYVIGDRILRGRFYTMSLMGGILVSMGLAFLGIYPRVLY
jgi:hypothetical protein